MGAVSLISDPNKYTESQILFIYECKWYTKNFNKHHLVMAFLEIYVPYSRPSFPEQDWPANDKVVTHRININTYIYICIILLPQLSLEIDESWVLHLQPASNMCVCVCVCVPAMCALDVAADGKDKRTSHTQLVEDAQQLLTRTLCSPVTSPF